MPLPVVSPRLTMKSFRLSCSGSSMGPAARSTRRLISPLPIPTAARAAAHPPKLPPTTETLLLPARAGLDIRQNVQIDALHRVRPGAAPRFPVAAEVDCESAEAGLSQPLRRASPRSSSVDSAPWHATMLRSPVPYIRDDDAPVRGRKGEMRRPAGPGQKRKGDHQSWDAAHRPRGGDVGDFRGSLALAVTP